MVSQVYLQREQNTLDDTGCHEHLGRNSNLSRDKLFPLDESGNIIGGRLEPRYTLQSLQQHSGMYIIPNNVKQL